MDATETRDAFLGGRVQLWQPRQGYRAGIDPVLLAASIPAKAGQSVLELGCGVGAASFCLAARIPSLQLTGVEIQKDYAALARRNALENDIELEVIEADLQNLPTDLRPRQFDHVIMNPPYFKRIAGSAAADAGRDVALAGDTPLEDWLDVGTKRVGPRGYLSIIQRVDRLPEVLATLHGRLGSIVLQPIAGREGRPPELFILQARQDGKAPFRLLPPLVLHKGDQHPGDKDHYRDDVSAMLRDGAAMKLTNS